MNFSDGKGEPYILDAIEEKGKKVPLEEYLAYGIDRVLYGDEFELLNVVMENRYYANAYSGKNAFISYIYLVGVIAIARGLAFEMILAYYRSFIPDEEEEAFDKFASRWESKIDKGKMKVSGRVVHFDREKNKRDWFQRHRHESCAFLLFQVIQSGVYIGNTHNAVLTVNCKITAWQKSSCFYISYTATNIAFC